MLFWIDNISSATNQMFLLAFCGLVIVVIVVIGICRLAPNTAALAWSGTRRVDPIADAAATLLTTA
jgi:hypothetical protein